MRRKGFVKRESEGRRRARGSTVEKKMSRMSSNNGVGSRTRVGKYELGRTLGEGNFAKVKFARNSETNEHVAIKILDKEKLLKHKMIGQVFSHFNFARLFYLNAI